MEPRLVQAYVSFFNSAIEQGCLKKVPLMRDPSNPRLSIVLACGHVGHNPDRLPHLWERVTDQTQLITLNGGGAVIDPMYARSSPAAQGYHQTAIGQIMDFVQYAVEDGDIQEGDELSTYLYYDLPCRVISRLRLTPIEFVESSIRAKSHLKGFHPYGVNFKVGLFYYLGETIRPAPQTYYAPRCDMENFIRQRQQLADDLAATPA